MPAKGSAIEQEQQEAILKREAFLRDALALRSVIQDPGWPVVWGMLENYADGATDQLLALLPSAPEVASAHAAAYALNQVLIMLKRDIAEAIHMAEKETKAPPVLFPGPPIE